MSLRMRLFEDNDFCQDNVELSWSSLEAVLTPCQSANESSDSGIGSSAELSVGSPYKYLSDFCLKGKEKHEYKYIRVMPNVSIG